MTDLFTNIVIALLIIVIGITYCVMWSLDQVIGGWE